LSWAASNRSAGDQDRSAATPLPKLAAAYQMRTLETGDEDRKIRVAELIVDTEAGTLAAAADSLGAVHDALESLSTMAWNRRSLWAE
jgi:hypothetical protein